MKEFKCGKIPPCYSGKKFRIHEELEKIKAGDETHDIVYELNKQMCDIGKEQECPDAWDWVFKETTRTLEESRKVCKEWDEMVNKLREKLEQMEKKLNPMTKAEAFEYLKGKKVLCYSSKMEAVQRFVKSLGFHWSDYSQEPMLVPILFLGEDGRLTYSVSLKRFEEHEYEEISIDDILSIEIVEEDRSEDELVEIVELGKKIQCLLSKLSGHRHVVITEDDIILREEGMCLFHSDPF